MHIRDFEVVRRSSPQRFTVNSQHLRLLLHVIIAGATLAGSPGEAWAQILTYQHPSTYTVYPVDGGPFSATAFTYGVPSGSPAWTPENTVSWRYVDAGNAATVTAGTYADTAGIGRPSYRFNLQDQYSCPWWGCPPRVELDSASPAAQDSSTPDPAGWSAGIIVPGMEQWFLWSMYLDPAFPLDQQWCTLLQFKHSHDNHVSGGWPAMMCNAERIAFGFGPDTYAPGQLWNGNLADLRTQGKWVDFALYAKWSTGADGVLQFYVNGVSDPAWRKNGNNFYVSTNGQPFYYVKQGYYRAATVTAPGTVYMTPLLVIVPASCVPRTRDEACGTRHCGTVSDGCGGTYGCGYCDANTFCGSGGYCYCSYPYRNCGRPLPEYPECFKICP